MHSMQLESIIRIRGIPGRMIDNHKSRARLQASVYLLQKMFDIRRLPHWNIFFTVVPFRHHVHIVIGHHQQRSIQAVRPQLQIGNFPIVLGDSADRPDPNSSARR